MKILVIGLLCCCLCGFVSAQDKVALLSTEFVLKRKFTLMEELAKQHGIEFAWTQVDSEGDEGVRRVLDEARFVIIDAPRLEDQAQIEQHAGEALRALSLPAVHVTRMSPTNMRSDNLEMPLATQVYDYYMNGTLPNFGKMFDYLRVYLNQGDLTSVPPPSPLPDGGIYHPDYPEMVFAELPAYLEWWQAHTGKSWQELPIIGMEISSSYLGEGQFRMLDESIKAVEAHGALPISFYRNSPEAARPARPAVAGRPSGRPSGRPDAEATNTDPAPVTASLTDDFPNPKDLPPTDLNEPLIMLDGKLIINVLMVRNFLGSNPDARKARYQSMGIPVLNILSYRDGDTQEYLDDLAGIDSFSIPFTLTTAEYIGMQDPIIVTANEGGEMVSIPEQLELLVDKAIKLARLQTMPNADKQVALLFWNHPPGEKNQGASNMNVPRSIDALVKRLRKEGYTFEETSEDKIIETVGQMLRPAYRPGALPELMKTPHWDFLPLQAYRDWYASLPEKIRTEVETMWGQPETSGWVTEYQGTSGFVIPRMKLGNLLVMPQPPRGELLNEAEEADQFHDTKKPVGHAYLATYYWVREHFKADAIVHFGTHGTQEWTPGKENGLWAFDYPFILVGNVPVVYPYIVDNISEAIHVKRRGRGVIVTYQTPPFTPAGLSEDFIAINEMLREYHSLDQGLVKENSRNLIIEQAVRMNMHKDMSWEVADLEARFDDFVRDIENYLEELGSAMQPLGMHTLGKDAEQAFLVSNVMQMLGNELYSELGVEPGKLFMDDFEKLKFSLPYRFVEDYVFNSKPPEAGMQAGLLALVDKGKEYATNLKAECELDSVVRGLSARWVDPSYGGDPIRNPDALPTGRNMYGFDPSRVPTRAAYEAGRQALDNLVQTYRATHEGAFPDKLAFSVWSTETMRHLGMLEAQIFHAMGVRPTWDRGGRVTGLEVIPLEELGRRRIDPVISITGLYRDQFPNVMERFNEAIVMIAGLDEADESNAVKANTARIRAALLQKGLPPDEADQYALTRVFGTESGDYGTRLPDASLESDKWEEADGKLENLYLSRMSWAYGPDKSKWSRKLHTAEGEEVNAYAEHLRGTSAVVFSRSSNLRGMLDTDHPFEYLGGISLAVKHLDGTNPQLYISNMRDPNKARLETAEKFMAKELRAVYQHPNWVAQMQKEGYSGTLKMLDVVNNFWGWQVMDRNIVRDDQWQEFHDVYVNDRYELGMREWFEQSNPTALAQISERMLEAIRKGYWKASDQTIRELVEVYQQVAAEHDVYTANQTFKTYVTEMAAGYGLAASAIASQATPPQTAEATPSTPMETISGRKMEEVSQALSDEEFLWRALAIVLSLIIFGMIYQVWQTESRGRRFSIN